MLTMKGMEAEYGNSVLSAQFYYEPETILKKKKENLLMKERKKNPKPKRVFTEQLKRSTRLTYSLVYIQKIKNIY